MPREYTLDDTPPDREPSGAGIWTYWAGGEHYTAEEAAIGAALQERWPRTCVIARHSREFQARVVAEFVAQGIDQIVDLGTGLPMPVNTHDMAGDAMVVYVDNDPLVLRHADALMAASNAVYVDADLTDAPTVLACVADHLDLTRPVGLLCLSTLSCIQPPSRAAALMRSYTAALAPGSMLAVCDTLTSPEVREVEAAYASSGTTPYIARTAEEILACAEGLALLDPGLVPVTQWPQDFSTEWSDQHGFVARVPQQN